EEPNYNANSQYLSRVGNSIHQSYGYIAERLFIDDYEVANSPTQFEDYKGGDIKYKDINGDGIISALDRVPIGQPTVPEVIYGFGFSYGVKNLDINAFFQGSARSSLFISPSSITPFVTSTVDPVVIGSQLVLSLQQIVSRVANPNVPTVLSFGKFIANGATNVIPNEVYIEGTFRTMSEEWRERALRLIEKQIKELPTLYGATVEFEIRRGYPALINDSI